MLNTRFEHVPNKDSDLRIPLVLGRKYNNFIVF